MNYQLNNGSHPYDVELGVDATGMRPARTGLPLDPQRMLRMLWRGKWWLLLAALVGCAGGASVAKLFVGKSYQAYSLIMYEGLPEVDGLPGRGQHGFKTLVDSVKLPQNLREARERLGMEVPVKLMSKVIDVSYNTGSNIVTIGAKGRTAEESVHLADTMVDIFLEYRAHEERSILEKHLGTIEGDHLLAEESLSTARKGYDDFRVAHGIADLSAEKQQAIEAAGELQAASSLARAEAMGEAVRHKQLRAAERQQRSTAILQEHRTSPIESELVEARTKLAQARSQLSDDHPRVLALEGQVSALKSRISQSKVMVTDQVVGINPAYAAVREGVTGSAANRDAAREREETLKKLSEDARERVKRLSKVEGEASKLLAAVRIAEKHVEVLEGRKTEVTDVARNPSTGFRIAERASTPEEPIKSKKRLMVAAVIPMGVFVLVLAFLGLGEFWGVHVKTPSEVSYWGRGPVIGSTTWPAEGQALQELIREFDDYTPHVGGRTLVVGATPSADRYARDVAVLLKESMNPYSNIHPLNDDEGIQPVAAGLLEAKRDSIVPEEESRDSLPADDLRDSAQDPLLIEVSLHSPVGQGPVVEAWRGPSTGPALRRAARLANRVMVVVSSGHTSLVTLQEVQSRLGRDQGIGYVVVDLDKSFSNLPDRIGDVDEFWRTLRV